MAEWLPRLQNEEAVALTDMEFGHFYMCRRFRVDLDRMEFGVLHNLFGCGEAYLSDLEAQRAAEKAREAAWSLSQRRFVFTGCPHKLHAFKTNIPKSKIAHIIAA